MELWNWSNKQYRLHRVGWNRSTDEIVHGLIHKFTYDFFSVRSMNKINYPLEGTLAMKNNILGIVMQMIFEKRQLI